MLKIPLSCFNISNYLTTFKIENFYPINYSVYDEQAINIFFRNKDWRSEAIDFKVLSISVDFFKGDIFGVEIYEIGKQTRKLWHFKEFKDGYLFLGANVTQENNYHEVNAIIYDKSFQLQNEFSLGNGVEDILINRKNEIVVSYCDEGVYGDFGVSSHGVVKFSTSGELLWVNTKHRIDDCYAINFDSDENLWFYYYDDFYLIKTNFEKESIYDPNITGSKTFMLNKKIDKIIMDKGYDKHDKFVVKSIKEGKFDKGEEVLFACKDIEIKPQTYLFYKSSILFVDKNELFFGKWQD
ncbi:MAG: hypothetical protein ACK5LP_05915 [Campylobacteraceae bacterium]